MGRSHQSSGDPFTEPKKRRRVGFFNADSGIEANECIKIYIVSSQEQVGAADSFRIDPIDLNGFFDGDGKIYGYQGLMITIWISSVTFHAYADIAYESTSDGGKGITDLKSALQRIFAETLVESKDVFLQSFSAERNLIRSIVSTGKILQNKASNGHGDSNCHLGEASLDVKVVRMAIGSTGAAHLYSRLIPLVLLLIDGSNPIDVTDPGWELFVLIQEKTDEHESIQSQVLGFAAVYRFYHYPDKTRLRLSQILVLPSYQHKGYGRLLVEAVNDFAVSEDVYELTVEEPLDHFQHVRTCVDIQRLLAFDPIQDPINSTIVKLKEGKLSKKTRTPRLVPPSTAIEHVRKNLKINKKQFLQCWEILIYLRLKYEEKYSEDLTTIIAERVKADILGRDSGAGGKKVIDVPSDYCPAMSFVMFRTGGGSSIQVAENGANKKEQLQQFVDERLKQIKLIAQKLCPVS